MQIGKENELQGATQRFQRDLERQEQDWSRRLQAAAKAYAESQSTFSEKIRHENEAIAKLIAEVPSDGEWKALTSSEDNYLIAPDAPVRDVANLSCVFSSSSA